MYVGNPHANTAGEAHVVFYDAPWDLYENVLRAFGQNPARVNFDNGTLEIMTLSIEHEIYKKLIGQMVGLIALEFDVAMTSGGSATLKHEPRAKGLESDECYWVANEAQTRHLERLDVGIHPPPDLVVEVDITHAVVDREAIYRALGVPEMWHFDTQTWLTAWEAGPDGWARVERSKAFPMIRVADLNPFLQRRRTEGETPVLRSFQRWLTTLPR